MPSLPLAARQAAFAGKDPGTDPEDGLGKPLSFAKTLSDRRINNFQQSPRR
jgi:hypothetical protein